MKLAQTICPSRSVLSIQTDSSFPASQEEIFDYSGPFIWRGCGLDLGLSLCKVDALPLNHSSSENFGNSEKKPFNIFSFRMDEMFWKTK